MFAPLLLTVPGTSVPSLLSLVSLSLRVNRRVHCAIENFLGSYVAAAAAAAAVVKADSCFAHLDPLQLSNPSTTVFAERREEGLLQKRTRCVVS
jgi:hypothetical protein